MSGPRKHDYLPIIGKLHEEYFGSEEKQRIAKRLAEERATANAEIAYRFANLAMPEDIRSRAKAWRLEAFCEVLWNNAFQAGFREATRTPDPAQIRADAIREAAALIHRIADGYAADDDNAIACGLYLTEGNVLALIDTPLSPTAVDGSPAPDAGGKGEIQ